MNQTKSNGTKVLGFRVFTIIAPALRARVCVERSRMGGQLVQFADFFYLGSCVAMDRYLYGKYGIIKK